MIEDAMRAMIREVVKEVLAEHGAGGKLAFSEPEATEKLGVGPHVLRDARKRGEIQASLIAGGRIRYSQVDIAEYLARTRGKKCKRGFRVRETGAKKEPAGQHPARLRIRCSQDQLQQEADNDRHGSQSQSQSSP